jgi:hypothetical protein
MADLTTVTSPRRVAPDRFLLDVPDGWQQGRGAFGGLTLAALTRALAGDFPLRSLTAELFAPVLPGPLEIRVETLRAGSGTQVAAARALQSAEVVAHAVAVLGRTRAADLDVTGPRASAPPWRQVKALPPGPFTPTFIQHFEIRATSPAPFSGVPGARTSGWIRPRNPGPARDDAFLVALSDGWWPALMARLATPRPAATIAFTLQILGKLDGLDPSAPLYHEADELVIHEGYTVEQRRLYGEDGRLLTMNQQTFAVIR